MTLGPMQRVWLSMAVLCGLLLATIVGLLAFGLRQIEAHYSNVAREMGRAFFTEQVVSRRWNAMHGGVYVPVSSIIKPNPYLDDPLRDVTTTNGIKLTKINPAFMTRLVSELTKLDQGITFHITSSRPLNPINAPDPWELKSLASFENGITETFEVRNRDGFPFFSYMGRLITETACLGCHVKDGYQVGDVRGGISVSVPYAAFLAAIEADNRTALMTHGIIALFGIGSILLLGAWLAHNVGKLESTNAQLAGTNLDLGERADELRHLNELKNKFLAIAAHDLRNPLTSISGMSKMIMKMELEEEKKSELVTTINRASDHMLALLNDLLDISVIESGHFAIESKPNDIVELIQNRVRLMSVNAEPKGIRLTTDFEVIPEFAFDRDRMTQVVDNLLSNAVKFSPLDTIVHVAAKSSDGSVRLSIADQGPGIPPEEVDRLFAPFEKLRNRPTGNEKSTGLGLSIVKRIVEAHGGAVSIDSEVRNGSTFYVTLPTAQ